MTGYTCEKCRDTKAKHSCPFQEKIHDNADPEYCKCCAECTKKCVLETE